MNEYEKLLIETSELLGRITVDSDEIGEVMDLLVKIQTLVPTPDE